MKRLTGRFFPSPTRAALRGSLLAFCCACALAPRVVAQINIESLRQKQEGQRSSTMAKVDLTSRSGNVDLTELEFDVRNDFRSRPFSSLLFLRSDLGWQDGRRFSNAGLAHLRYVHLAWERLKPEIFGQVDYDKSRKLDRRNLVGAGVRIELLHKDAIKLAWGTAYMLEHERYDLEVGAAHDHAPRAHRWSNYISMSLEANEKVTVAWTAYAQPRFDDFEDAKLLSEASMGVKLSRTLALSTTFRAHYDGRPPDGIEDLDTRLATGINVQF